MAANPRTRPCSAGNTFQIGGVAVAIEAHSALDVALPTCLAPFKTGSEKTDVTIQFEWVPRLAGRQDCPLFDSGAIWRLYREAEYYRFDFAAPMFGGEPYKSLVVDDQFRRATLRLHRRTFRTFAGEITPLDYPLDELLIMHRLTQVKGIELHACGIVHQGNANLFVGHSGAGKSTTTRLWTRREDVLVLSDDRIILRRDRASGLRDGDRTVRMFGTPWHGEAMYASPESAALDRIFILEHGYGNVVTQLAPGQAVAELFARSFVPFHRHAYVDSALDFLQELAEHVPVYRYAFEPDDRAVDRILNFND